MQRKPIGHGGRQLYLSSHWVGGVVQNSHAHPESGQVLWECFAWALMTFAFSFPVLFGFKVTPLSKDNVNTMCNNVISSVLVKLGYSFGRQLSRNNSNRLSPASEAPGSKSSWLMHAELEAQRTQPPLTQIRAVVLFIRNIKKQH